MNKNLTHTITPATIVNEVIDSQPLSRFQVTTMLLCGCVAVLDGFDTQSIGFLAPAIADSLKFPLHDFAPVFIAGLLGLMCGAGTLGPLADRFGRRWTVIGATLLFGICSFLTGFVGTFDGLLILRFLTGIGLGGALTNVVALTAEYSPRRLQAIFVSMLFAGMPAGAVVAGLVASRLLPLWGWQSVFLVGGMLPLVMVVILVLWLPESVRFLITRRAGAERVTAMMTRLAPNLPNVLQRRYVAGAPTLTGFTVRHLFTQGRAVGTFLLWVPYFMNLLIIYFVISWFPAVLRQSGMPTAAGVIAITSFSLGGVAGSLLQGIVMARLGARRVIATEFALSVLLIGSLGILPPSFMFIMCVAASLGVFVQGAQAGLNALVAGFYPTAIRSTGVGWALAMGRIGSIVGPVLGGVMLSLHWDLQQIFLAGTIPAFLAGAAVLAGAKSGATSERAPNAPGVYGSST